MTNHCAPDTFQTLVTLTGIGPLAPVTVRGPVDFTGVHLTRPIVFSGVVFSGTFTAADSTFGGNLTFENCQFERGIDLSGAQIGGSLQFYGCKFSSFKKHEKLTRTEDDISLMLDHVVVAGDVIVDAVSLKDEFLHVASRSKPGLIPMAGSVYVQGAEVQNTKLLGYDIRGHIEATGMTCKGDFRCDKTRVVGRLNLYGATVQSVFFHELQVGSYINAMGLTCMFLFRMRGDCGGNLHFEGATIKGQLDLSHITQAGAIVLNGTRCGSFLCGSNQETRVVCLALFAVDSAFTSYVHLPGLRVRRDMKRAALQDESNGAAKTAPIFDGVKIAACRFENGLAFWLPHENFDAEDGSSQRRITAFIDERRAVLEGSLELSDCQITGDLDLTHVDVWGSRDGDGTIAIDRTTITGALRFCSPVSFYNRQRVPGDAKEKAKSIAEKGWEERRKWQARATALRLVGTSADTIDLTGLRLQQRQDRAHGTATLGPSTAETARADAIRRDLPLEAAGSSSMLGSAGQGEGEEGVTPGSVDASRVNVPGTFKAYDELGRNDEAPSAFADIPGALILERATLGELVVSAKSFDHVDSPNARQDGIVLERATIGQLTVPKVSGDGSNGFPVPLNLSGTEIAAWSFAFERAARQQQAPGNTDETLHRPLYKAVYRQLRDAVREEWRFLIGREDRTDRFDEFAESENYLDVLDNDETLHRPVYKTVYRQLRDAGHDRAARRIFIAEEYRARWDGRGGWERGSGRHRFGVVRPGRSWKRTGAVFASRLLPSRWGRLSDIPVSSFFLIFLRYGISAWRLVLVIVVLAGISFFYFARDARNFELGEPVRRVIAAGAVGDIDLTRGYNVCDDGVVLGPDPALWRWTDAVWMTVRHHIPIVGSLARADFQPTDDRPLVWATSLSWPDYTSCPTQAAEERERSEAAREASPPGPSGGPAAANADDWFHLMSLVNWVLWPILLTFLLRQVLRE